MKANIQYLGKFCVQRRAEPILDMVCGEPRDDRQWLYVFHIACVVAIKSLFIIKLKYKHYEK